MSIETSGNTTGASCRPWSSLVYEDLDGGLRGQFVAATVLVAVLSWTAEALSSFWERSARLSGRAVIIGAAEGAVATNGTWVFPRSHLSQCARTVVLLWVAGCELHAAHFPFEHLVVALPHGAIRRGAIWVGRACAETEASKALE
jgi:hypothetical protein